MEIEQRRPLKSGFCGEKTRKIPACDPTTILSTKEWEDRERQRDRKTAWEERERPDAGTELSTFPIAIAPISNSSPEETDVDHQSWSWNTLISFSACHLSPVFLLKITITRHLPVHYDKSVASPLATLLHEKETQWIINRKKEKDNKVNLSLTSI